MTFEEWERRNPQAANELRTVVNAVPWPVTPENGDQKSEAWAQQRVRMQVASLGGYAWRNNVGATPAKCKVCNAKQQPVRYGLANDSEKLNSVIKSSDLILAIPRLIKPADVGTTIAQFGSIETKKPGWVYSGKEQEHAQAAWLSLISKIGGFACFSTGDVKL
jgi:hypothetical protein